ncbi:hypothetical protein AB1Y20_013666 [Prymnesium parvum]|uniref:JmjC domain-containing protein n=1 Tax=Prymnesium parvum TaxID=97485 RepID=A0AB34IGE4_PRYPA
MPSVESVPFTTAAALAEAGLPRLLTHSPWPSAAAFDWSPARLAQMAPLLQPVRTAARTPPAAAAAFWNPDATSAARNNSTADFAWRAPAAPPPRAVRTAAFFSPPPRHAAYHSADLRDAAGAPHADLLPLAPLLPLAANGSAPFLKAWLGTAGALTPCHYDSQHNFYAQLHGEKRFVLLPSRELHARLYIYPSHHPLAHFSRLPAPLPLAAAAFPRFADATAHRYELTLRRGDVLYLPPFWAHEATCLRECISANAWLPSVEMELMAQADALPLPFEEAWPPRVRLAACLGFLARLVEALRDGRRALELLLATRWRPRAGRGLEGRGEGREAWRREPRASALPLSSPEELLHEDAVAAALQRDERLDAPIDSPCEPEAHEANAAKLADYASRRAAVLNQIDAPHRDVLLADQLEQIAYWAAGGAALMLRLLVRLTECTLLAEQLTRSELHHTSAQCGSDQSKD